MTCTETVAGKLTVVVVWYHEQAFFLLVREVRLPRQIDPVRHIIVVDF